MKSREGFGYIYVATNPAHVGIVKIGKSDSPNTRIKKLSNHSGVPAPFQIIFSQRLYDYHRIERVIHRTLHSVRNSANREFFKIAPEEAVSRVQSIILQYQREQEQFLASCSPLAKAIYEARKARGGAPLSNSMVQKGLSLARRILKSHGA
jgi:hypothetical protein